MSITFENVKNGAFCWGLNVLMKYKYGRKAMYGVIAIGKSYINHMWKKNMWGPFC